MGLVFFVAWVGQFNLDQQFKNMKNLLCFISTSSLLSLIGTGVLAPAIAQIVAPEATPTVQGAANSPSQSPAVALGPLPIVDPANEIKGIALVEALRKGGYVLYMRHTEAGSLDEKCDENSLSAIGTENARIVGAALRDLRIPVGNVRSSVPCRTNMTGATLGLGTVEITEDLNPIAPREGFDIGAARSKRLNETPVVGKNTVLVSHMHGSRKKEEWLHLQIGEIIVFRPDSNALAVPVARIPVAGWAALKKLVVGAAAR